MTDTSSRTVHRRRQQGSTRGRLTALAFVLLAALGGFILGLNLNSRDLVAARQLIQQLQTEAQKYKKDAQTQSTNFATLQLQVTELQNAMHAMKPAQNTYDIKPNESLVVGDGHLTIGLVGTPNNDTISINVNGKRQAVTTGDVINLAPDPSTNCQVTVQSFDMFKATLVAACTPAKP